MKELKFTESQIIGIIAKEEQGLKVSDICREHGINIPIFQTGRANTQEWMLTNSRGSKI
tara:strand:- start:4662 stop:4838 length:177 start_codon:yes stop_codon:yes gene_type:complete